jgi:hypothetical protein
MGVMAGRTSEDFDELYEVKPEEFTALRTKLAAAAKQRGDTDTAKQISAARKPTAAAWVVNRVALRDQDIRTRLAGLGQRLRDAYAAMDGDRIRELSAEQRRLVEDVSRAAFEEAELADPSAALRDDVTATLQAAIADPDVAARLGRLTRAERWSGFGEFSDTAMVFTSSRKTVSARKKPAEKPAETPAAKPDQTHDAARREREKTRAALAAAQRSKADADAALTELQSDLATARLRRDDARRRLQGAEDALTAAEDAYDKGKQASREAAAVVKAAKAALRLK